MLPTRSRLAFRQWRRTRPFWGGLFLLLSGVEFYVSAHMDLLPIHVSLGAQGFLSWLIPLAILLCGLLTWFTPAQRIFYGIVGAAIAVAALIGLNLGGFFVGMLLGMLGGALAAAWTPTLPRADAASATPVGLAPVGLAPVGLAPVGLAPVGLAPDEVAPEDLAPPNPTPAELPPEGLAAPQEHASHGGFAEPDTLPGEHPAPRQQPAPQDHPAHGRLPEPGEHAAPREQPESGDVETTDVLPTGPLTDQLPTATRSPLGVPPVQGGRHAADGEGPPTGRLLTLLLLIAAVTTALLALPQPKPAAAAPCPANPAAGTAAKPPAANAQAANPAAPAPAPASPTGGGDPLTDFLKGVGKLIGITPNDTPSPSPSASPSPSPSGPSTPGTPTPKPTPAPTCSPAGSPGRPRTPAGPHHLAAPAGQPTVNQVPSTQISALLSETGLSFDGVVDLPVKGGTIRALQFSLASAESTPFELRIPGLNGGPVFSIKSSKLTVSGHVRLYATRIQGLAAGVLPQDYTPDSPPPITPPVIFFTHATVQLVFIRADKLTAAHLTMGFV